MSLKIEILQISCGKESIITTTEDRKEAKQAYCKYCLISANGGRVRVDGKLLPIHEANKLLATPEITPRRRARNEF